MEVEKTGEIIKLSSGDVELYVILYYDKNDFAIEDYNKIKADKEFFNDAVGFATESLKNYKND